VGTRAGLERCGKSRPPPGLDPRTVQFVGEIITKYIFSGMSVGVAPIIRGISSSLNSSKVTKSAAVVISVTATLLITVRAEDR